MKLILENWKRFLTEAEGHLEPIEVHRAPPGDDDGGDDKAAQTQTNQKLAEKLAPLIASGRDGGSRARVSLEAAVKSGQISQSGSSVAFSAIMLVLGISTKLLKQAGPATNRRYIKGAQAAQKGRFYPTMTPWLEPKEKKDVLIKWFDLLAGLTAFVGVKGSKAIEIINPQLHPMWKSPDVKKSLAGLIWAFDLTARDWDRNKQEAIERIWKIWTKINNPRKP